MVPINLVTCIIQKSEIYHVEKIIYEYIRRRKIIYEYIRRRKIICEYIRRRKNINYH